MVTVAPAGMTAPFVPLTAFCVVAVTLSPTLMVLVHTVCDGVSESVVPAAMLPTAPPPLFAAPPAGRVTTLPLGVVRGVLLVELLRGSVRERDGSREVVELREGAEVEGGFAGTSFS
jgi:hypothetical protein